MKTFDCGECGSKLDLDLVVSYCIDKDDSQMYKERSITRLQKLLSFNCLNCEQEIKQSISQNIKAENKLEHSICYKCIKRLKNTKSDNIIINCKYCVKEHKFDIKELKSLLLKNQSCCIIF